MKVQHAYRPIPMFNGAVLKYAGEQHEESNRNFFDAYWKAGKQGNDHLFGEYLPGVVWADEYLGDRIYASDLKPFAGK